MIIVRHFFLSNLKFIVPIFLYGNGNISQPRHVDGIFALDYIYRNSNTFAAQIQMRKTFNPDRYLESFGKLNVCVCAPRRKYQVSDNKMECVCVLHKLIRCFT